MRNFFQIFFVVAVFILGLLTTHYSLQTVLAFVGPTQPAGTGGGLFSVDSSMNIGFGTSDPAPTKVFDDSTSTVTHGYIFAVSSTTPPGLSLKNQTSGMNYLWSARNEGPLDLYRESTSYAGKVLMRITELGFVGISTFSPAWRLHVDGDIGITNGAFRGSGAFLTSIDAVNVLAGPFITANYAFPLGLAVGTSTTANLPAKFYTLGTTNITGTTTLATTAGNVGIGTASPDSKLEVEGTGNEIMRIKSTGSNSVPAVSIQNDAKEWLLKTDGAQSDAFIIRESGVGDYFTILPTSGNVGIASSSPGYGLTVVGTGYFSQPVIIGTPTADSHAATKNYVDSAITSGSSGVWLLNSTTAHPSSTTWKVAIGTTTATESLEVGTGVTHSALIKGNISAGVYYDVANSSYYIDPAANQQPYSITTAGAVGIATTSPAYMLDVVGTMRVTGTSTLQGNLSFGGAAVTNLNMNNNNILAVNKITAATIDPLYEIDGKKYATYASAIAGGVKEEYVGRAKLTDKYAGEYVYKIDFEKVEKGSDIWVWRNAVDFSKNNVEVFTTPYGGNADIYYTVGKNNIEFHGNAGVEFSYRLVGKRHDWKNWPTLAKDQLEQASFIIK